MAQYYSVKPTQVFTMNDVVFYPGRGDYLVAEEVYNGKLSDGQTNFKDLCEPNAPMVNVD